MSFAALAFVTKLQVETAAEKLIALAYADRHNEETGCAYPSIASLTEFSCLNRKTVIAAVARLEAIGFMTDTGERKGKTLQIKVYRLNIGTMPKTEQSRHRDSSENGTVPKTAGKQSQKRDTEPVTGTYLSDATHPQSARETASPERAEEQLPDDRPTRDEVVDAWNDLAGRYSLPKVRLPLTSERKKRLDARIRDHPMDDWRAVLEAIPRSPFLLGQTGNWRGATFDFLLQPSSFLKTLEGNYDRPS